MRPSKGYSELVLSRDTAIITCLSETQRQVVECEIEKTGGFKYAVIRGHWCGAAERVLNRRGASM